MVYASHAVGNTKNNSVIGGLSYQHGLIMIRQQEIEGSAVGLQRKSFWRLVCRGSPDRKHLIVLLFRKPLLAPTTFLVVFLRRLARVR
jgi:hypothetical protein